VCPGNCRNITTLLAACHSVLLLCTVSFIPDDFYGNSASAQDFYINVSK
jgi:hypothetical protein